MLHASTIDRRPSAGARALNRLKSRLLDLSPEEASFVRRGFAAVDSPSRAHLEQIIESFIAGYNIALVEADMLQLTQRLDSSFTPPFVGFAYEGAGLYFALADLVIPRAENRLAVFTRSFGEKHDFITMVGAGFAVARIPFGLRRLESYQRGLDPLTAWCLADGYGFHHGFFHWRFFIAEKGAAPASLNRQNRGLFDAGVGRAMWWVFGADPESIKTAISGFERERRAEMWTGIGTAVAYAGGVPADVISILPKLAGEHRFDLLSGIPFAAHMRAKGGNPAPWTDEACSLLLNRTVNETSNLIAAELKSYLNSTTADADKRNECYLTLRSRVKRRLEDFF
jgi:hypothetical protein